VTALTDRTSRYFFSWGRTAIMAMKRCATG
jgi:hypothetical protein